MLPAADADIHGSSPQYEQGGGKDQIGFWGNPQDYVSWNFKVTKPGEFAVSVTYSCDAGRQGSQFTVEVGGQKLTGTSQATGSWATYRTDQLGHMEVRQGGRVGSSPDARERRCRSLQEEHST